jgi:hypothetical protein
MFGIWRKAAVVPALTLCLAASAVAATDSSAVGWKKSLIVDITTTQTAYSNSWVGGEAGSVNWVGNLNGTAENQFKPWLNFRSVLKLSFGQTLTQDAETNDWSKPKKSTDLIDWENVARFTLGGFVDPYAAFRVESQFYDGTNPNKRLYLSPLLLTESAGISRKFYEKDKDVVLSRLGLAVRQNIRKIIIDSAEAVGAWKYTVDDSMRTDGGIESVTDATLSLRKNLRYTGKLSLFKALFFSKKDEVKGTPYEDDWKAIDVNLENIVSASITKVISVNLYTQLLYDKQVSRKGRLKETLAIGFVFKMV